MPTYDRQQLDNIRIARRAARRAGLDPNVFQRQMGAEANFRDATSPAGAQGPAQIMPATARGWGVRNVRDPREAYGAAAKNMAAYVKKYGSYENALRAYNAGPGAIEASKGYGETNAYVKKILTSGEPAARSAPSARGNGPGARTVGKGTPPTLTRGGTKVDTKGAVQAALLDKRKGMSLLARINEQVSSGAHTTTTPAKVTPGVAGKAAPTVAGKAPAAAASKVDLSGDGKNDWGVLPDAGRSGRYLQKKFKIGSIGGYRANDPFPDHPSRKALDLMVGNDSAKGSAIAQELVRNYKQHKVKYLIWNQRIWRPGQGWKAMEDRGSPTQNHKDHVHVLYA